MPADIAARATAQLVRQIDAMWTCPADEAALAAGHCPAVLDLVGRCLAAYRQARPFSLLHAAHWCIFLQFLRQEMGSCPLSEKLYLANRALHGVDMYAATLPERIYFEHPVGTVIGRARLGDRLVVLQNVTVGGSRLPGGKLYYPDIGNDVILYSGSAVIGRSTIGDRCILSTGTRVLNQDVPPGSLVFGTSPELRIKPLSRQRFEELSPFRYV